MNKTNYIIPAKFFMEQISYKPSKYDAYRWMIKVTKSCKTHIQLAACTKLIYNFHNMYNDEELYRNLLTFKLRFSL